MAATLLPSPAAAAPGTLRPVVYKTINGAPGSVHMPMVPEPPEYLEDGRQRLAMFDFGPPEQPAGHRTAFGTTTRNVGFGWTSGMVRQITRRMADSGPFLCDFVEGEDAEFTMAVEPGDSLYQVIVTLGDPDQPRGPLDIVANGETKLDNVTTEAGKPIEAVFEMRPEGGRLAFRLVSEQCRAWAAVGATIYGPKVAHVTELFPSPETRSIVPPPDSLTIIPRTEAQRVLRAYCEFLNRWAPRDGGFTYSGAWYQNAYPIRTLLAGSVLLNEPTWRDSAFALIDRFVAEQRADGGWYSDYFGRRGCGLAEHSDTTSSNLADIGSMTLCMSLASQLADSTRRDRWISAARRYADQVALPVQRPEGWFPNLRYKGRTYHNPYSVATATQVSALAVLGALTGEPRYIEAAERGGQWLAKNVRTEGTVAFAPYDSAFVKIMQPTSFGDTFYLMEAITWVEACSPHREVQIAMRRAMQSYIWGSGGLRAVTRQGYWFSPRNAWSDSKMGGAIYLIARHEAGRRDPALGEWLTRCLSWVGDPGLSQRIGILAPPPSRNGEYGMVATGFAGIGVAALIDPDVLVPRGGVGSVTGAQQR